MRRPGEPWRKGAFPIRCQRRRASVTGWVHAAGYGVDRREGLWVVTHLASGLRLHPVFPTRRDARAAVEALVRDVPELAGLARPPERLRERVLAAIRERECT